MQKLQYILFLSLISTALTTSAGSAVGKITHILSGPEFGTKVFIAIDTAVTNKPSCAVNNLYSFGLDSAEPGANMWLSMATVAYTSGKTISISGFGENKCTHWVNIEDLKSIRLQ